MRYLLLGLLVLMTGCMKPMIEQTIQGDHRLTVMSDTNWFTPSFTLPVREKCIPQDGVATETRIDDQVYTCYGTYVEVQHLPAGFQNGAGSGIGDSVTTVGSAALVMHGLRGIGGSSTTNNNNTDSNGGQTINSNANLNQAGASAVNKNANSATGGSVTQPKPRW